MRTLQATVKLFAEYGVGATSYQMIADAIGVTKGAIYHQFKTKDEIVIAVAEMELARLEDALEAAEAEEDPLRGREVLLHRVIDHAVELPRCHDREDSAIGECDVNRDQFIPILIELDLEPSALVHCRRD